MCIVFNYHCATDNRNLQLREKWNVQHKNVLKSYFGNCYRTIKNLAFLFNILFYTLRNIINKHTKPANNVLFSAIFEGSIPVTRITSGLWQCIDLWVIIWFSEKTVASVFRAEQPSYKDLLSEAIWLIIPWLHYRNICGNKMQIGSIGFWRCCVTHGR
jgi:hypothetical protein